MLAAAEPLRDDPDDRREDDIQVTQIPDCSIVSVYPVCGDGEERLTPMVPVSRPALWNFGLYRRGSFACV